jgi:isopentenyl phosphate kinase
LLAGIEDGVWSGFPARAAIIEQITPDHIDRLSAEIGGSASVDVTGGMIEKVRTMLALAAETPGFHALIFSGKQPGLLKQALLGASPGTRIGQPPE